MQANPSTTITSFQFSLFLLYYALVLHYSSLDMFQISWAHKCAFSETFAAYDVQTLAFATATPRPPILNDDKAKHRRRLAEAVGLPTWGSSERGALRFASLTGHVFLPLFVLPSAWHALLLVGPELAEVYKNMIHDLWSTCSRRYICFGHLSLGESSATTRFRHKRHLHSDTRPTRHLDSHWCLLDTLIHSASAKTRYDTL